jgi:hypothetical protein
MEFKELLVRASLTNPETAADYLGVSRQTIYRYITHGAPAMALKALEFRAGTNPRYWGLAFRDDGVWSESRRLLKPSELVELDWQIERAYQRGIAEGLRRSSGQTGG